MTDEPRNAESWAKPVSTLTVTEEREGAPNLVDGKRLLSPVQGFGKMWQKTYKVRLVGVDTTPAGGDHRVARQLPARSGRRATTSTRR